MLLLGLEGGLRMAGFGRPANFLIPDAQPGFYRTNPDFVSLFLPGDFDLRPLNFRVAARKPPNTVRIFILGESAAQGVPEPSFGFAPQLRAQLRARYPDKNIEVINTGIVAINSHVVYRIARDLADFSPDLFVVYLGNNEVVGPYGPGCAYLSEMPPVWIIRLSVSVRSTRTGQLIAAALDLLTRRTARSGEWGGMAMFAESAVSGDDPRLEAVYRNFETNLRDIVRVATDAGAQALLCTVVSNLKDCAPLLSVHRPGLSAGERADWQRAFDRGRLGWLLGEAEARAHLLEALRLDPQYADTAFLLGSLELQAGNIPAAREHFLAAQHWDALRFRPDPRINQIVRQVAARTGRVGLLDTAVLLGSDPGSTVPPAGRELLFEHVHLDWSGNYQVALAMAQGAASALFGDRPGKMPWLDSPECAASLGYSAHARLSILQRLSTIIQNPPFTHQLTYPEDMARLASEVIRAQADRNDPATLRRAQVVVQTAAVTDRENPALAKLAEDIAADLGDLPDALTQARRAQQLQPASVRLAAEEAMLLSRLGRYGEAEKLLQRTAATCPSKDLPTLAPACTDFYTRTKRFEEGRRFLDGTIARRPGDRNLQLLRGRLARYAGDAVAAERDYRAILAEDPAHQGALEALVAQLNELGQTAAANEASLAAADRQTDNPANNLRVALLHEARGDEAQSIRDLLAAQRSGPVNAAVELRLARKLYGLGRLPESLTHLALAQRISRYESDSTVTVSIGQLIARLRAELH